MLTSPFRESRHFIQTRLVDNSVPGCGPVTDGDEGRDPVSIERYQIFPGPVTGGDEGRDPATTERYRRDLDEKFVAIVHDENLVVVRFSLADVAESPALNAEGGLAENPDVSAADLHPERRKHMGLIVLDRSEAPVSGRLAAARQRREVWTCRLRSLS